MTSQPVVVTCAADDCSTHGVALPELSAAGVTPGAPHGWGQIDALRDDGVTLHLFVCSRSCERRLARNLAGPRVGQL